MLEKRWIAYRDMTIGNNVSTHLLIEAHRAFFAGAVSLLEEMAEQMRKAGGKPNGTIVRELQTELREFAERAQQMDGITP